MRDPLFWKSLTNTIYFTAGSLCLGTVAGAFTCPAATEKRSRRDGLSNDFLSSHGGPFYRDLRDLDLDFASSLWLAESSSARASESSRRVG